MKSFFRSLAVLLCAATLIAQDYSKLPELPVWYQLDNANVNPIAYLPDFDSLRGGLNALAIQSDKGITNQTWYNRFQVDTMNMFSWSTTFYALLAGDFDGDGVDDYYGGSGDRKSVV